MATFRAVILKGKVHIKQDGTTNVKIRVTHNRKPDYISTDLYVNPNKFKKGYLTGDTYVNSRITDYLKLYSDRYIALKGQAEKLTVQELKQILANKDQSGEIDFLAFAAQYMQELEAKGKSGSYRGSRGLITHLKGFASKINFSDINAQFLSHFEEYLRKEGVNDIHTYFARLRLIFNRGKDFYNDEDRGIIRIPNYPFKKVKIKKTVHSANEHSLTVAQARRLLSYQPKNEREQLGKDVFAIMTCLMGINAIDLFYLKKPLKNRVDYTRSKTGRKYSIKIEPELQEFINRIPGSGGQLFNFSERYQNFAVFHKAVNTGLKSICKEIRGQELNKTDFPENVTSNWARHTWATIARNDCGINKDDVALCLGHVDTDNRVTDMYIKYDYSIIDGANRKVLDKNS